MREGPDASDALPAALLRAARDPNGATISRIGVPSN
jgi:hypothetical protein